MLEHALELLVGETLGNNGPECRGAVSSTATDAVEEGQEGDFARSAAKDCVLGSELHGLERHDRAKVKKGPTDGRSRNTPDRRAIEVVERLRPVNVEAGKTDRVVIGCQDFQACRGRPPHVLEPTGSPVRRKRVITHSKDGGEDPSVLTPGGSAVPVDAWVRGLQLATRHPPSDGALVDAGVEELASGEHAEVTSAQLHHDGVRFVHAAKSSGRV